MIYLDYQATTPLSPEALAAMMPYLTRHFGNPHSADHQAGRTAAAAVTIAAEQVAAAIGARPDDILFTSGATEANNLALKGVMAVAPPSRRRLVTLATEHSCVLESARFLAQTGVAELVILPVQADGLVDLEVARVALTPQTALLSVMAVNNEIGVCQPVADLAAMARAVGAVVHCDGAQALGQMSLDVDALGVDLLSLSAHKCYGPKGIGALYHRPGFSLGPQMHGGGQQAGGRSGTLSPALCAGFGVAAQQAAAGAAAWALRAADLWHQALALLDASGVAYQVNGSLTARCFGNLSLSFPGCEGARLLADLRGVALSSGAACASRRGEVSHVLRALGVDEKIAGATLRIGFGLPTSSQDVAEAMARIIAAVRRQKA